MREIFANARKGSATRAGAVHDRASSMRYLLAVLFPPGAVLLCGTVVQALLNLLLTMCFWVPGAIHACVIVQRHTAETRGDGVGRDMRQHRLNSVIRRL
jgi:uncharacterized membrane protein YqaE (UPF0057 family)